MNMASTADATRKASAPSPINSLREASEALSAAARSAVRAERGDLLSLIQSCQLSLGYSDVVCHQWAAQAVLFGEWDRVSPQYPRYKEIDVAEELGAGIVQ